MKWLLSLLLIICSAYCFAQNENAIFERSKGKLDVPVKKYIRFLRSGPPSTTEGLPYTSLKIYTSDSTDVKALFDGKIIYVKSDTGRSIILTKFGDYFIIYFELSACLLKDGDQIHRGQFLGHVTKDDNDEYCLSIQMSKKQQPLNPYSWIKW